MNSKDQRLPSESARPDQISRRRRIFQCKRGKPCVYCGGAVPGTTCDHVFPENLFLPVPLNAITVPACDPCNQEKAKGDEPLGVYVKTSPDALYIPNRLDHLKRIARAIQRNQSPMASAAWKAYQVRKQVDPLRLGGPLAFEFDTEAMYRTLRMIVRGLFFANLGRIMPGTCPVDVVPLSQDEAPAWLRLLLSDPDHYRGERGEVCEWLMFVAPSNPASVMCALLFNRGVFFLGASGAFVEDQDSESLGDKIE